MSSLYEQLRIRFYIHQNFPGDDFGVSKIKVIKACFNKPLYFFVRQCQTPVLILPDDIPAHPYAVAMESALLAPNAEVSLFPWKEPKERVPLAVRQIRSFLRAHRPVP